MKYLVLYSDNNGESHFKDVEVKFEPVNFAPPAPPVGLSSFIPARQLVFFNAHSGWYGDWHPAPKRQFFCCISGEFELTTTDGQIRNIRSGDVLLLEDTTGKGHKSRCVSKEDFMAAVIQVA